MCYPCVARLAYPLKPRPQIAGSEKPAQVNANFRDLQSQLEGTENRITVARNRYIQSVQAYNVTVRSFPSNLTAMVFGYSVKANFTVDNEKEIAKVPKVDFGSPLGKPQAESQGTAK